MVTVATMVTNTHQTRRDRSRQKKQQEERLIWQSEETTETNGGRGRRDRRTPRGVGLMDYQRPTNAANLRKLPLCPVLWRGRVQQPPKRVLLTLFLTPLWPQSP